MGEKDSNPSNSSKSDASKVSSVPKQPKLEEKPFELFINDDFIPCLKSRFTELGFPLKTISLEFGERPVVGGSCWMVKGVMCSDRRFWLCFSSDLLSSPKTVCLAEPGTEPSLLESFLIDEKKTSLALLVSRLLQRLNGQKWLGSN